MNRTVHVLLLGLFVLIGQAQASDLAVRAGQLLTGTGETLEDAVVVIEEGRISAVGPADQVSIPSGMNVLEAAVVTPGLVDGRSVVGLSGALNQDNDQDQLEHSAAIQPELRAIDAYNPRERLVTWLREHGVTTIHTGHGPGEVISGQTLIAKTTGDTVTEAVMVPFAGLAVTLGESATVDKDVRPSPDIRPRPWPCSAPASWRRRSTSRRGSQRKRTRSASHPPATWPWSPSPPPWRGRCR
ncbi:MAG: hypothetical protein U5R48_01480 [Gammaproteobacteria bacterium]|nr:hypothetical protein [Gammaproteobacteria bacterium]